MVPEQVYAAWEQQHKEALRLQLLADERNKLRIAIAKARVERAIRATS